MVGRQLVKEDVKLNHVQKVRGHFCVKLRHFNEVLRSMGQKEIFPDEQEANYGIFKCMKKKSHYTYFYIRWLDYTKD